MSKKSYDFLDKSIKKIITSKSLNSDNNNFLTNVMGNFNKSNINSVNANSISIKKNSFNSFSNLKPKKQFILAGKPVQVFNNNPIPNKNVIENTYNQIPDDRTVPLQFMTRKQYYQTYAKNQECINGKPFNKEQKQQFFKGAKKRYSNIVGRYTTESNPYYPPAVVVFNDKDNLPNIKGQKFKELAWHEFGHEYVEEKQIKMPLQKEELFADTLAMNKTMQKQVNLDMNYNNTNNLKQDKISKNDIVYHGTTPMAAMLIKKQGILTSNELKKSGIPYHTLSEKTRPDKTYFFKDKPRAESWARVATQNSMFPNAPPKVVVADVPGNELVPDLEMETGGAYYKEGGVKPEQIISSYDVENDNNSKNKVNYRGESFPGYNIPKEYKGAQKYKKRVLANDGVNTKIINFGHKDYSDYTIHKDYDRMKNFRARHKCDKDKSNKLSARHWSCENLWPNVKPDQLSKNKFKPFRNTNAEELTAAKRFGGKNLQNLKQLGQGRDRRVYALDDDKVLKVAKNPGGLTQNTMESDLDYPTGQIKHYETGMDYVVMERADKPGKATTEMMRHLKKAKGEINTMSHLDVQRSDFFNSPHFEASGLEASDFSSHSVNPIEFAAKRQWGEKDGKPVLIDGGALTSGDDLSRHRVKDFQTDPSTNRTPWQLTEWQEVQVQRRQNKNKGRIKPNYPEYQERGDVLADLYSENKYIPTPGIMERFSENPTRKVLGTNKGECDEAASCIVTDALKQGVPFNKIQVLGVRAPNPNKGEKPHSSHVVTNVEGSIFDPTKTQFGYDNPGPLISDKLDDKYHSLKVLPTEPYIKSSLNYVKQDSNSKNMAYFSINQENEIYGLNWNKDQKGKKLGEGAHGEVFEVKDNPKYIIKVPKQKQGYYGSTKEEMNKYDQFADNELIAPSIETKQGIVREKLNVVSRGATKQDWDSNKKKNDPRVIGYSFFEKNNINKKQAKQVIAGVNDLSQKGILMEDELQIGISPTDNKPYLYDIGTFSKQKDINVTNYARDDNDRYKKRFLEGVGHSKLFDRDYDKEADDALKEIESDTTSENKTQRINIPLDKAWNMRKEWAGPVGMKQKRTDTSMNAIGNAIDNKTIDPIYADYKDYKNGLLTDGKHRLIKYKEKGYDNVDIEVHNIPDEIDIKRDTTSENKRNYINLNEYGKKEHASKFGYDPTKTLVHGTTLEKARQIQQSGKLTGGTFVYPGRGGFEDASTWAKESHKDSGVVIMTEANIEKPLKRPWYEWITLGDRQAEREGHDMTMNELPVKKMKIFKVPKEGDTKLYEIDSDGNIKQDEESKNKLMFWKKNKPQPENYETSQEYPEVTNQEFVRQQQYDQSVRNLPNYGEVQNISGNKVGNAIIAADVIIPSGKLLTLGGLGVKKYVDKVKLIKTDEHDNKYIIPRMEIHNK